MRYSFFALSIMLVLTLFSGCVSYTPNQTSACLLSGHFMVRGKSMAPTIASPGIVLVKPVPYEEIQRGDVLVYTHKGRLIAHRAIQKVKGAWLTQGDGMKEYDPVRVAPINYRGLVYTDNVATYALPALKIKGQVYTSNINTGGSSY